MSLNSIEFVNPEGFVIKSEKPEEDIFDVNPVPSNLVPDVYDVKCGEIFTSNNSDFTLICAFCGSCYSNIPEFGEHLRRHNKNDNHDFYETIWDSETKESGGSFDTNDGLGVSDSQLPQDEFECKDCKVSFGSKTLLKQHKCQTKYDQQILEGGEAGVEEVEDKHPMDNKPTISKLCCTCCHKSYSSEQTLRRHKCKRNKESKQKPIVGITPHIADEPEEPSQQVGKGHSDLVSSPEGKDDPSELSNTSNPLAKKLNPDFYCELCDQQFSSQFSFRKHGMRHPVAPIALQKDPDYLKCSYCGLELANTSEWYDHENSHTEENKYQCPYCPKRFKRPYTRKLHMYSHTGDRPFKCPHCGAAFSNATNMQTHVKGVHLRLLPYACTLCDKKFVRNVELKVHMRQHTGEKPYQCEECGKNFMLAVHLNEHRKRHANLRDAKCPSCPMAFNSKKMLARHMIKHSDLRPHKCATCGQTFSRKNALATHAKIHQDVKEYVCIICGKAFAQPAGLHSHKKSHMKSMDSHDKFVHEGTALHTEKIVLEQPTFNIKNKEI